MEVKSNVSGVVIEVLVAPGASVKADQDVVSIESMKMEMFVPSPGAGRVKEVKVATDDFVQEGQVLLILE
jgi:biotin carboxyl carrier protein